MSEAYPESKRSVIFTGREMVEEIERLRQRVSALESYVDKLQGDNGVLSRTCHEKDETIEKLNDGLRVLGKQTDEQIAALKAEVEFQKQTVQADLKCIERLNAQIADLRARLQKVELNASNS